MDIESQSKYYDNYWSSHQQVFNLHEYERVAMITRALAERIKISGESKLPIKICDLGCGRGWLSDILSRFGDVTGLDFSPEAINNAKIKYPHVAFIQANALEYTTNARFDIVVSSEVIEHIEDQRRYIQTAAQIINPEGYLILTCPNGGQWDAWQAEKNGRQPIENWPLRKNLKKMLRMDFDIKWQTTFFLYFSHKGHRRILNAPMVIRILRRLRLLNIIESIRSELGEGLYQIVLAQRKTQNKY